MKFAVKVIVTMSLIFSLGGCAAPVTHNTPSGKTEVNINGATIAQVQPEIMNLMINRGYNIKSSSNNLIVFEKPLNNVMAAMFFGSKYDSTPNARVTYNILQLGNSTRVVASFAAITNPGSAFERVTPMDKSQDTAQYQKFLDEIKNRLESSI